MFYNRKAIQKRIILERYKDEDIDPTWYTGSYGDDVEGAENSYYRNHGLHHSQYAPDHGPSDLRPGEIDNIEDYNGQYTNEKGERRGGAYGAAKLAQAKWVEWCGEHYPDKKWEDVAADVVSTYYTQLKAKYEQAQARENQLKDRIRSEKGEGRVREIETHNGMWSDIGYSRKQGTNFASEIEHCEQVIAKPKHFVLRSEGLRALSNIEDINVDDLYGNFERKHDQYNQAQKDNWVGWYAMFKYFAEPALELINSQMNTNELKQLANKDWTDFGMTDEDKANREALKADYKRWQREEKVFMGQRPPKKYDSLFNRNNPGIGTAARREILKLAGEEWRDSIRSASGFGKAWTSMISNFAKSSLGDGKYANPELKKLYSILMNIYSIGSAYNQKIIFEPDEELKNISPKGGDFFSNLNKELETIWKKAVQRASYVWNKKHPKDAKGVQHSKISGAWNPGVWSR